MLQNYSAADGLLTINGTAITDFGETDPSVVIEDINPRAQLKRGLGAGAAAIHPVTIRKRLTINLMPGSPQARWLIGLSKAKTTLQATWTQMGTAEAEALIDGVIVSRGARGRIAEQSSALSDEQFVIEFRDSTET